MSQQRVGVALVSLLLCSILVSVVECVDDPYKTLGVSKSASQDEIKRVYKALALKWHPDKNENSEEAQKKFVEITTAYEILTDDEKRRQYENAKFGNQHQHRGYGDAFGFNYFFQNVKPIFSETFSLTFDNFDLMVHSDEDMWMIEFYSDRCQPCIENSPIWEQTAKSMSEFVKFGRINTDEQSSLMRHFRVRNIPSLIALVDGSTHYYNGRFDVGQITEFIKRMQPSRLTQINNMRDWENFKNTRNNKPLALLFSSHSSTISPLYKYTSHKYSHMYNYAQIMTDKLDAELADKLGVSVRPTIIFFPSPSFSSASSPSSPEFSVVPGPFTKQSLAAIIEEYKYTGILEFTNDNFVHLCGRKSTVFCGITFTSPQSKHFSKHLTALRQLSSSDSIVKLGWIDSVKLPHFLSHFNFSFIDRDQLQGMIIWDGAKKKYTVIKEELKDHTLPKWSEDAKSGRVKFVDLQRNVPPLVELPTTSLFFLEWLSNIFRFVGNNLVSVLIVFAMLYRIFAK